MNTIGYFEIQSSNPTREIEFYRNVFGWNFTREFNVHIEYYRIETESIFGGLLQRPVKTPPAEFGYHLSNMATSIRLNLFVKIELQLSLDNPFEEHLEKNKISPIVVLFSKLKF